MISFPHAKINIGLRICRKRPDGFHDIESVFCPVACCDALEITPAPDGRMSFRQSGFPAGPSENNLVMKAYRLMDSRFGLPPLHIHLHKAIPSGAGLGGGSSDAAFCLRMLNEIGELGISPPDLHEMAAELGSDCPYFLQDKPAFVSGRGEVIEPFNLNLSAFFLLLVKPKRSVSTARAYSLVKPCMPKVDWTGLLDRHPGEWAPEVRNDFEITVMESLPELQFISSQLAEMGAAFVSMSGSGSVVYGIFDEKPVFNMETFPGCWVWTSDDDYFGALRSR